jgi:hypothetical protein
MRLNFNLIPCFYLDKDNPREKRVEIVPSLDDMLETETDPKKRYNLVKEYLDTYWVAAFMFFQLEPIRLTYYGGPEPRTNKFFANDIYKDYVAFVKQQAALYKFGSFGILGRSNFYLLLTNFLRDINKVYAETFALGVEDYMWVSRDARGIILVNAARVKQDPPPFRDGVELKGFLGNVAH